MGCDVHRRDLPLPQEITQRYGRDVMQVSHGTVLLRNHYEA